MIFFLISTDIQNHCDKVANYHFHLDFSSGFDLLFENHSFVPRLICVASNFKMTEYFKLSIFWFLIKNGLPWHKMVEIFHSSNIVIMSLKNDIRIDSFECFGGRSHFR